MLYPAELRGLGRAGDAGFGGRVGSADWNRGTYLGTVDLKPVKVAR